MTLGPHSWPRCSYQRSHDLCPYYQSDPLNLPKIQCWEANGKISEHGERAAAADRAKTIRARLEAAEAELAEANRRYDVAAMAVCRALRVPLQRPV